MGGYKVKKWDISPKTKKTLLIVLISVLSLILLLLVAGFIYMDRMLNLINKNPDDSTMSSQEVSEFLKNEDDDPIDPNFTVTTGTGDAEDEEELVYVPLNGDDNVINIMLIGQDRLPGEGRTRSDTMILLTVNKKTKEMTMTSFMRDMYVSIPGYEKNKMNCGCFEGQICLSR